MEWQCHNRSADGTEEAPRQTFRFASFSSFPMSLPSNVGDFFVLLRSGYDESGP
jgi:hypothetical protein